MLAKLRLFSHPPRRADIPAFLFLQYNIHIYIIVKGFHNNIATAICGIVKNISAN